VMLGGALSALVALPLARPISASGVCLTLLAPEIALLGLLEVVLGPLWAWLGAGETPAASTLTGGALVLVALAGNELAALGSRTRNARYRQRHRPSAEGT